MIEMESEHKSLENVQPDDVVEMKNSFSGEKFKSAAEIYISSKEPNANPQDNGGKCLQGMSEILEMPPITGPDA